MQATGFKATPMVGTTTVTGRRYESFRRVSLLGLDWGWTVGVAGQALGRGAARVAWWAFLAAGRACRCLSVHLCKVAQRVTLANAYLHRALGRTCCFGCEGPCRGCRELALVPYIMFA